jgi:hypothetical protein
MDNVEHITFDSVSLTSLARPISVGSARNIQFSNCRFEGTSDTLARVDGNIEAIRFVGTNTGDFKVPFFPVQSESVIAVH